MDTLDTRNLILEIARERWVDPRSVRARLAGRPVRGLAGARIDAALRERGITPPDHDAPQHDGGSVA